MRSIVFTKTTSFKRLSLLVLAAIILGILAGLLFGSTLTPLKIVAPAYIMLVQSVVYPFIISSIVYSLAQLNPEFAKKIFRRGWMFYAAMVILSLMVIIILSLAIPRPTEVIISSPNWLANIDKVLKLIVPQNIFDAIINNIVPAAVIFSILFGFALQKVDKKDSLLDIVYSIRTVSLLIWTWLVAISPFIAFCLTAYITATVNFRGLVGIGEYLLLFYCGAAFITFVMLPLLLSSFTSISYKKVFEYFSGALLVGLATSLTTAAIPVIIQAIEKLLADAGITRSNHISPEEHNIVEATTTISYPLVVIGNLFLYLFIVFAAFYFHQGITPLQHSLLPMMVYLSSFGSTTVSINSAVFLSQWLGLPHAAPKLYVDMMMVTRYGQVISSVMGIAFLVSILLLAYYRKLRFHLRYFALFFILFSGFIITAGILNHPIRTTIHEKVHKSLLSLSIPQHIRGNVKVKVYPPGATDIPPPAHTSMTTFERIQKTHTIRVGYNPDMWPFVYFNNKKQLVGFDVTLMYSLANTLHAKLIFIPFKWQELVNDMQNNRFDIAIGSIYVTGKRLTKVAFTTPYFRDKPALVVRKNDIAQFKSRSTILANTKLRIAVFNDPIMLNLAKMNFLPSQIVQVPNYRHLDQYNVNAAFWTKEHVRALASLNRGFDVVIPYNLQQDQPLMIAFMVNRKSTDFLNFLNYWLRLEKSAGFIQHQINYWINLQTYQPAQPRSDFSGKLFAGNKQ